MVFVILIAGAEEIALIKPELDAWEALLNPSGDAMARLGLTTKESWFLITDTRDSLTHVLELSILFFLKTNPRNSPLKVDSCVGDVRIQTGQGQKISWAAQAPEGGGSYGLLTAGIAHQSSWYCLVHEDWKFSTVAMSTQGWILEGLSSSHEELRKCWKALEIITASYPFLRIHCYHFGLYVSNCFRYVYSWYSV